MLRVGFRRGEALVEIPAGLHVALVAEAKNEPVRAVRRQKYEDLVAEQLLVATGRRPNTEALRLELAGVEVEGVGQVVAGQYLQTTNLRVFAVGDVSLGLQFVHLAAYEGTLAAENTLRCASRKVDLETVPSVISLLPPSRQWG